MVRKRSGFRKKSLNFAIVAVRDPWSGTQNFFVVPLPMGEGKSWLAFTVVKQAKHSCSLEGCSAVIPFDEIKHHEGKCIWRLVICPGSDRSCNVMVPFQKAG